MLKRPLIFIFISFILGICAAQVKLNIIYIALFFVAAASYVLLFKHRYMGICFVLVISFSLGMGRYFIADKTRDSLVEKYDGQTVKVQMLALDFSSNNSFPAQIDINGKKIKIYAYIENCPQIKPGDILSCALKLSVPLKDENSTTDFASYLSGRNIYLSGYGEEVKILDKKPTFPGSVIYSIRTKMGALSESRFKGESQALFSAMVYGDKRFFADELSELLQKSGQNHIAVVSGMHLSIMSSIIMMIIGLFFGKKRIGNIIAIGAVLFMTFITGAGSSVVRACVMCVIFHVAQLLRRESDSLTSLFISAFLMLLYNPFTINNAGFVLSVLSVLGIILYAERFTNICLKFMPKAAAGATGMCIGAQLTVVPAVMHYFGIVTPYAPLSNLLIFTFASMMVIVGLIFVVFSQVPIVSTFLAAIVEILATTIISVCEFIEKLPFACVNTGSLNDVVAIICATVLITIYFYPRHKSALLKLCAATLLFSILATMWMSGKTKVEILDYSLGDCLFIKGEETILIGCEDSKDAIYFAEKTPSGKIYYVMQTSQKTNELLALVQSGKVKNVILNKRLCTDSFIEKMKKTDAQIILLGDGEEFFTDEFTIAYDKSGEITENAVVHISTEKESITTLQSLDGRDVELLYKGGSKFYSTYFVPPRGFSKTDELVYAMVDAKNVEKEKKIFLKR